MARGSAALSARSASNRGVTPPTAARCHARASTGMPGASRSVGAARATRSHSRPHWRDSVEHGNPTPRYRSPNGTNCPAAPAIPDRTGMTAVSGARFLISSRAGSGISESVHPSGINGGRRRAVGRQRSANSRSWIDRAAASRFGASRSASSQLVMGYRYGTFDRRWTQFCNRLPRRYDRCSTGGTWSTR